MGTEVPSYQAIKVSDLCCGLLSKTSAKKLIFKQQWTRNIQGLKFQADFKSLGGCADFKRRLYHPFPLVQRLCTHMTCVIFKGFDMMSLFDLTHSYDYDSDTINRSTGYPCK